MAISTLPDSERQIVIDQEHLKLLSIAYLIDGAMYAVFSPFGLFYAAMGGFMTVAMARAPVQESNPAPPAAFGLIFVTIGFGIFAAFAAAAVLKLLCAHRLRAKKSRTFCLVVAALSCFAAPYGTAIGLWTFLVLLRPTVAAQFAGTTANTLDKRPTFDEMRGGV